LLFRYRRSDGFLVNRNWLMRQSSNKAMKQTDRFVTLLAKQGPRRERPQLIARALEGRMRIIDLA